LSLPPSANSRDRWLDLADEARDKARAALANGDRRMAELWDEHERTLLRNAYEDVPHPDAGAPATGGGPTGTVGDLTGPISSQNPFDAVANDPDVASPQSVADGEGVQVADESAAAMWRGLAAAGLVGAAEMARQQDPLAVFNATVKERREQAQAIDQKHNEIFGRTAKSPPSGSPPSPGNEIRQRGTESFPSAPPPFPATPIPPQEMRTPGFPAKPPISPEEWNKETLPADPIPPNELQTPPFPADRILVDGIRPIVMKGAKFPTAQDKGRVFIYPELSRFLEFPTFVERNETQETRDHIDGARDKLIAENPDCKHVAGGRDEEGNQIAEKALPNPTPPRQGWPHGLGIS
jgi:hypothetical protein